MNALLSEIKRRDAEAAEKEKKEQAVKQENATLIAQVQDLVKTLQDKKHQEHHLHPWRETFMETNSAVAPDHLNLKLRSSNTDHFLKRPVLTPREANEGRNGGLFGPLTQERLYSQSSSRN